MTDRLQLELFTGQGRTAPALVKHWRRRLAEWPTIIFMFRHDRHTANWRAARQGFQFAQLLHDAGAMPDNEYARWVRFNRRVLRWDGWDL